MSIYLWELSWDNIGVTAGAADVTWDRTGPLAAISMEASFVRGSAQTFTVQVDLWAHSFGGGPTYELVTQQSDAWNTVPLFFNRLALGTFARSHVEANGQNGAAFKTGPITISLSVDDVAHTVTANGPLGSFTYTFVALGMTNGTIASPQLSQIGMFVHSPKSSMDWTVQASFYNFYLSKDGVRIAGAQMGSVQPGTWLTAPWGLSSLDTGTGSLVTGQTASRQIGGISYDHLTNIYGNPTIAAVWQTTGAQLGDIDAVMALLCEEQSGALVYARVIKQAIDSVEIGVSFDSGHTWTTQKVGQRAGAVYATPSLAESPNGGINLFAWDRSSPTTRWFRSHTQGSTWEDFGILLSVLPWSTSSSPKVFTLPSGFFLVSYNHAGNWFLAVYEGGSVTSAGIQTTDMGANILAVDTFPGMHMDALGSVYAARAPSVLVEQFYQSKDLGVDWAKVLDTPTGAKQLVTASHRFSPFVWKLWQTGTGAITVAAAEDFGSIYLFGGIVAFAGAAQQYCGLAVLPKGFPIFVFQTYHSGTDSWSVDGFHSEDLGRTWIAN
jgi:hypothetical protein